MKRTQIGWVFIFVISFIIGFTYYRKGFSDTLVIIDLFLFLILLLFYKLTIQINDYSVKFSLGIGIIKGEYPLSQIEKCNAISYIPFGWGIRFRPGVIIYNVSGKKAIELIVKNKSKKIWLSTNDADGLSNFINDKINSNT